MKQRARDQESVSGLSVQYCMLYACEVEAVMAQCELYTDFHIFTIQQ